MIYTLSQVEERVYALLDENRAVLEDRTLYGDPNASLRTLIREFLPEAAEYVMLEGKNTDFSECEQRLENSPLIFIDETRALIRLPANFVRLLYLKMTDWDQGIYETLQPGGAEYQLYARSRKRYWEPGVRKHPAASIGMAFGRRTLEIFNTSLGAEIDQIQYLCRPEFDGVEIDIPQSIFPRVCRRLAQTICEITTHT